MRFFFLCFLQDSWDLNQTKDAANADEVSDVDGTPFGVYYIENGNLVLHEAEMNGDVSVYPAKADISPTIPDEEVEQAEEDDKTRRRRLESEMWDCWCFRTMTEPHGAVRQLTRFLMEIQSPQLTVTVLGILVVRKKI